MRIVVIAAVVLLLCLLALMFTGNKGRKEDKTIVQQKTDSGLVRQFDTVRDDAPPLPDTLRAAASEENRIVKKTSVRPSARPSARDTAGRAVAAIDSAARAAADSAKIAAADSVRAADTAAVDSDAVMFGDVPGQPDCANDTVAPWVYPEPSGGLHRGPVAVRFFANKRCTISWRSEGPDTAWKLYDDTAVTVDKTVTIAFKAVDRCGHAMKIRQEYYELAAFAGAAVCPQGMELVKIGAMRFCVDRYEWPNRKGTLPQSYVTLYQARDSCFSAGKRLCTSEEWSLACSGPYSGRYPYGQDYEPRACVTSDTSARPSGFKPECRAFFGAFDMSGNLLEWTGTPSRGSPGYYNVMGGFWKSGIKGGCFDVRSSYFPQNRHNPVGFRCCKDAAVEGKQYK
jgi:hypothetical protein